MIQNKLNYIYIFILTFLLISINTSNLKSEVLWAYKVIGFSSEYDYRICSAKEILGKPSIFNEYKANACAWSPQFERSNDEEWIHVEFEKAIPCEQVAIHETCNPGSISKVFIYFENNENELIYENTKFPYLDLQGRMFNIFIKRTKQNVKSVKVFLQTSRVPGFNYIDAIGISDTKDTIKSSIYELTNNNAKPINLGNKVNSIYPELAPIISYDGNYLFFTRNLHHDNYGEEKKYDVWYSKLNESTKDFDEAINIGRPINNEKANFVVSVMPGNNELILGNVYLPNGEMSKGLSNSFTDGKIWSTPEEIKIKDFVNVSTKGAGYCISSSGKKMILSIDNDDSKGKNDLFISFLQKDGNWSKPKNLGNINTASSEETPFLAADEKTLYFSTNGRPGYGQNDIFISRRLDDTWQNWSEPINLGSNVNSNGWDGYYTIPAAGDFAYFVSTQNSYGNEDIFKIELPDSLKPTPVVLISGKVLSSKDSNYLSSKIIYEDLDTGEEIGVVSSNPLTGEYKIILPAGKNYGFLAQTNGFVAVNQNLDLKNIDSYKEITSDLTLVPIEKGSVVRINNIFFDFGKSTLLPQSFNELNRLVKILNDNASMKIEIQGHTDNIGSNERNLTVSRERATAVMSYLVSQGISADRIHAVGFGKNQPVAPNDNEENRAKNRRVEFLILSK